MQGPQTIREEGPLVGRVFAHDEEEVSVQAFRRTFAPGHRFQQVLAAAKKFAEKPSPAMGHRDLPKRGAAPRVRRVLAPEGGSILLEGRPPGAAGTAARRLELTEKKEEVAAQIRLHAFHLDLTARAFHGRAARGAKPLARSRILAEPVAARPLPMRPPARPPGPNGTTRTAARR